MTNIECLNFTDFFSDSYTKTFWESLMSISDRKRKENLNWIIVDAVKVKEAYYLQG